MKTRFHQSTATAKTREAQAPGPGWKPIGHINQLRPKGAAECGYVNGAYNCAPATVAMVARGWGRMSNLTDAQLVSGLARDIVTREGTTPDGVAKMLARVNVPIAGKSLAGRFDDAGVKQRLRQGNMLIAQVGLVDAKTKQVSPHYVLVRKLTPEGNYLVSDPMSRKPYEVTPELLRKAVHRAPPDGGVLIPIGRPGGDLKPPASAAPPPAERPMPLPRQEDGAVRDGFSSAGARDSRPSSPLPTPAPSSPAPRGQPLPDMAAFSATEDVFTGLDTRFQEQANTYGINVMRHNEGRIHQAVRLSYLGVNSKVEAPERPVTPGDLEPQDLARRLARLKSQRDPRADLLLQQLERSPFQQDRDALNLYRALERKQPGIGKKTNIESFG
jgi:hypothetical protein